MHLFAFQSHDLITLATGWNSSMFYVPVSADVNVFPVAVRAFTAVDRIVSVVAKCVFAVCNQSCTCMARSVSVLARVAPIAGLFL